MRRGGGPRHTFPPYSPDDIAAIKLMASNAAIRLVCPQCDADLGVFPFVMPGTIEPAYELRCEPCRRFVVVRQFAART
jgi:hypothetical protein